MLDVLEPRLWLPRAEVLEPGGRFAALLEAAAPVTESAARPADLACVLFTSGSSGEPKAALHTQRGLAYKARVMAGAHQLRRDDSVLMPPRWRTCRASLNAVLVPGAVPMPAHLMARWDPERALRTIETQRITFMIGPPTFFVALMGAPDFASGRVESLRLVSSGGAGVTPAFVAEASERLGARVKRTYGSTEAPTVTTSTADDSPTRARETDGRPVGAAAAPNQRPGGPGGPSQPARWVSSGCAAQSSSSATPTPTRQRRRCPELVPHRRPRHR